jgi:hypothetical protein
MKAAILKDYSGRPVQGLKFALVNEDASDGIGKLEVHTMECGDLRKKFPSHIGPVMRTVEVEADTILELSSFRENDKSDDWTAKDIIGTFYVKSCAAKAWKEESANV